MNNHKTWIQHLSEYDEQPTEFKFCGVPMIMRSADAFELLSKDCEITQPSATEARFTAWSRAWVYCGFEKGHIKCVVRLPRNPE